MQHLANHGARSDEIVALFQATFSASEGPEEGALIGKLARDLLGSVPPSDLRVFVTVEGEAIIAAIVFTKLSFPEDSRTVFLLAPVAVATAHQGRGVGQALLRFGLSALRAHGADVALTYGDISFYGRVGFAQISEAIARPPLPLQHPEGWLGQSLTAQSLTPLQGRSTCVEALSAPEYW